ncbi:MAG: SAM-dependent methyltransferase [Planctomycetota bacterium]
MGPDDHSHRRLTRWLVCRLRTQPPIWLLGQSLQRLVIDESELANWARNRLDPTLRTLRGRGGGARYLAHTHRPSKVVGVDFSKSAVELCRKSHRDVANLEFVTGDAEDLPLDDASCDVVINVESSHCYGNVDKFFAEVMRVLRPGGHFACADFRSLADMKQLEATLASLPGCKLIESVDITERVVAALVSDDVRKRRLIEEIVTPRLRHIFGEFAGLSGGQMFTSLQERETVYYRFLLQK